MTAVQTSEQDLFDGGEMSYTGILSSAKVAMEPTGDGNFMPTVVVNMDLVGPGRHHVTAHIHFPRGQHQEAIAAAARLHPGQQVTVTTPLPTAGLRLILPTASLSPNHP